MPTGDGGRDSFSDSTVYDALNRPVQLVTPHSTAMRPDVLRPGYDQAALLSRVDVWLQQAAAPAALLDPATAGQHAVTGIEYNARGQRLSISFGNGTGSGYSYDPQTFRLANLTTTRPASFAASQRTVQDLAYYYDPVGKRHLDRGQRGYPGRDLSSATSGSIPRPATPTTRCTG